MRTISILNFKGGVGKTTIAINLADRLSRIGKRVLLFDCDRQRNTTGMLHDYRTDIDYPLTLRDVLMAKANLNQVIQEARPNFYIVPSHSDLEEAAKYITVSGIRTQKLLSYIVADLKEYDYILFDHSPSYGAITDAALLASKEMIIPVELEPYAFEGLLDMINKVSRVLTELEHEVDITGIVPNNLDYTKSMTQVYFTDLKKGFPDRVTPPIRTDAKISKSQEKHLTVFEYDTHSKGVQDFNTLASFLLATEGVSA